MSKIKYTEKKDDKIFVELLKLMRIQKCFIVQLHTKKCNYPIHALHISAENAPPKRDDDMLLKELPGRLI